MWRFVLLAACSADPDVEIVKPADSTTITTSEPIVFEIRNEMAGVGEIYVDGRAVQFSERRGNCEGDGTSRLTWIASNVANGSHEVRVVCEADLVDHDDTITLVFARP